MNTNSKAQTQQKPAKKETKAANTSGNRAEGEAAVLTKIALMPARFRAMGERLHALILRSAPMLQPTVWYGMPGYAKDGKVILFFRADKYMTFGLNDTANFDREKGAPHQLMPSAWFFSALDDATEAELSSIVRRAAG